MVFLLAHYAAVFFELTGVGVFWVDHLLKDPART
jgi:hypothetical protein